MPFLLPTRNVPLEGRDRKSKTMEQHYWMHRCTCGTNAWQFTHELLKKHEFISIGWSDFSTKEYQSRLTDGWESFERVFLDAGWGLPRNRYNLWRFLNEMHTGDYVVVPLPGRFDVYRIADEEVYNNETIDHSLWVDWNGEMAIFDKNGYPAYDDSGERQIDMGFYRRVEKVALDIPRQDYAGQALYLRLKIMQTNACIDDLKAEVDEAIDRFIAKNPINLRGTFVAEASKTLLEQMQKLLNDTKLERLVQWYMQQLGADATIPPKNSTSHEDGDADVVATFSRLNDFTVFIQVKAHQGYTDEWAVKQITDYKKTMDKKGILPSHQLWVISTCKDFSEQAKRDAEASKVRLVNGLEFAEMLVENGVYSLPL